MVWQKEFIYKYESQLWIKPFWVYRSCWIRVVPLRYSEVSVEISPDVCVILGIEVFPVTIQYCHKMSLVLIMAATDHDKVIIWITRPVKSYCFILFYSSSLYLYYCWYLYYLSTQTNMWVLYSHFNNKNSHTKDFFLYFSLYTGYIHIN